MRCLAWALCVALGASTTSNAQTVPETSLEAAPGPGAPPTPGAIPGGPGVLTGRVVHAERPDAAGGVPVLLYALDANGTPGVARTEAGESGDFRFGGLSTSADVIYLVGARFDGVLFPGERFRFEPGRADHASEVRIADASEDAAGLASVDVEFALEWGGTELIVRETHRFSNQGPHVIYVEPERRAEVRAPYATRLPESASALQAPLGVVPEGIERDGRTLRYWGPMLPGTPETSFQYTIPTQPGDATVALHLPPIAARVRLVSAESVPLVGVDGLVEGEPIESQGRRARRFERSDDSAAAAAVVRLAIPELADDPSALALVESRWILELDDAALNVSEESWTVRVEGDRPLLAPAGESLFRVSLPEGASDLRFASDTLEMGLTPDAGGLGIRGPLPPGESVLRWSYRIPARGEGVSLEREIDRRLPLLAVFVADTGIVIESDRLHRRRPIRTPDRFYMALEAFEVEPDETLALRIEPIPVRTGVSRPVEAAFVLLAAGLGAWFVLAPVGRLRRDRRALPEADPERAEREIVYEAIRDLEHDFETGKVEADDFERMRSELRGRARDLLRAERARAATEPAPTATTEVKAASASIATACPHCGAPVGPSDKFCAQCGGALGRPDRSDDRGTR